MHRSMISFAAAAGLAAQAHATWSIIMIDTRTGEIAVGSATCLTNFDLQAGTPVLIPGVAAATAQSSVDQGGFNRVFIRDRFLEGVPPQEIIDLLAGFDTGHRSRQYGMADVAGGVATFTGSNAGAWAGGVTGRVGDVVYAVQGNVLTGEPVVTEAERVIITSLTSGLDLPETMMLAMEEARVWGGDGRCSCSNNDADGCGSPPDGWDPETGKSAHIAYMLTARAGDGFGCNSVYRTVGRSPFGLAYGDFNGDGLLDLVAACRNSSTVDLMLNTGVSPHYATFAAPESGVATGLTTGVAAADFNRDGRLDYAYGDSSSDLVGVVLGNGDGTFAFVPQLIAAQDGTAWVAAADFNGDHWPDIAATNTAAGTVTIMLNDGAGRPAVSEHVAAGLAPGVIVAAEIDGQPGIDLACTDQDGDAVHVLRNDGAGGFTLWQTLPTGEFPQSVAAGDFDGDGRTDLASADRNGRTVTVFRQTTPGDFTIGSIDGGAQFTAIETLDVNGDGLDDLGLTQEGTGRLTLLLGQVGADPAIDSVYALGQSNNDLVAADFTGDGRADIACNLRSASGVMIVAALEPASGAYFNDGTGCATADYFMEFNIAFQSSGAPDPVEQLHDLFDTWRIELIGVTDAVQSIVERGTDRLPVGSTTTITVEPRDWALAQIGPGLSMAARHAPGSAGLSTIGEPFDRGDGSYTIEVSAADLPPEARGLDIVEIEVVQEGRTVILMPRSDIHVTGPVADWNGDGTVDPSDLTAFLADWEVRAPETDLDGNGQINTADIVLYVKIWAGN